jgi:hypothetical protein
VKENTGDERKQNLISTCSLGPERALTRGHYLNDIVEFLTCIREVPGSNPRRVADYP